MPTWHGTQPPIESGTWPGIGEGRRFRCDSARNRRQAQRRRRRGGWLSRWATGNNTSSVEPIAHLGHEAAAGTDVSWPSRREEWVTCEGARTAWLGSRARVDRSQAAEGGVDERAPLVRIGKPSERSRAEASAHRQRHGELSARGRGGARAGCGGVAVAGEDPAPRRREIEAIVDRRGTCRPTRRPPRPEHVAGTRGDDLSRRPGVRAQEPGGLRTRVWRSALAFAGSGGENSSTSPEPESNVAAVRGGASPRPESGPDPPVRRDGVGEDRTSKRIGGERREIGEARAAASPPRGDVAEIRARASVTWRGRVEISDRASAESGGSLVQSGRERREGRQLDHAEGEELGQASRVSSRGAVRRGAARFAGEGARAGERSALRRVGGGRSAGRGRAGGSLGPAAGDRLGRTTRRRACRNPRGGQLRRAGREVASPSTCSLGSTVARTVE